MRGPDCAFLFVDTSRPGTRRWCATDRVAGAVPLKHTTLRQPTISPSVHRAYPIMSMTRRDGSGAGVRVPGCRNVIAAGLGALTLLLLRRLRWPGHRFLPGLVAMGLGLAGGYPLFLALAMQRVPASHGAVVIGLVPAATGLLSAARMGERLPVRFWLACVAGFAAVFTFALTQGGGRLHAADPAGPGGSPGP